MNRKEIVAELETKWGVKAKYLGAPSFAYEVGDYRIDKNGEVTYIAELVEKLPAFEDLQMTESEDLGLGKKRHEEDVQGETGMQAVDCLESIESDAAYPACAFLLEGFSIAMLRNLLNMLSSKEKLITAALALEQTMIGAHLAEEIAAREIGDVDEFISVWHELEQGRAPGVKFNAATRTLRLEMPKQTPTEKEMEAFSVLMVFMVNFAKRVKSASRKPAQHENPKFAFRTWLTRLGMNGDEYKAVRKLLLARLAGNSAFRSPRHEDVTEEVES